MLRQKSVGATIYVEWGYELHSITLTSRNWGRIKSGKPLRIRGKGYLYEAEFFWDYWNFEGGMTGELVVEYGNGSGTGTGFIGLLRDADIVESVSEAECADEVR